jgi:hypothetical protein
MKSCGVRETLLKERKINENKENIDKPISSNPVFSHRPEREGGPAERPPEVGIVTALVPLGPLRVSDIAMPVTTSTVVQFSLSEPQTRMGVPCRTTRVVAPPRESGALCAASSDPRGVGAERWRDR